MNPRDELPAQVSIAVTPYASALPLGCFSFAIGNALYAAFLLHWIPAPETRLLAVTLLTFVAPLELIACVMAFLSRDTGAATAMGIFAAAWVVQGVQLLAFGSGVSFTTAALLLMLAICLGMLVVVTARGKPLVSVLLGFAVLRSVAAGVAELGAGKPCSAAAAGLGFAVAVCAFYCGFAFLLEDVQGSLHMLTGRAGDARAAMTGSLGVQMGHVEHEAGVRQQL